MKRFNLKSIAEIDYKSITLSEELLKSLKTYIWVEMHDAEDPEMPRDYQADVYQELLDQICDCIAFNRKEQQQ
tara:strand:+ start:4203 stop:4421 length:219 start_codon:yes stop_codon:yes gene_type:complete